MTDDRNQTTEAATSTESQNDGDDEWTREQWVNLAANPTQHQLGYEVAEWNTFETGETVEEILFLPNDASELKDAAFVVSAEDALVDLQTHC